MSRQSSAATHTNSHIMPEDNSHLDEFLADLSPDELRYVADASKRMCDAEHEDKEASDNDMAPEPEEETYTFED